MPATTRSMKHARLHEMKQVSARLEKCVTSWTVPTIARLVASVLAKVALLPEGGVTFPEKWVKSLAVPTVARLAAFALVSVTLMPLLAPSGWAQTAVAAASLSGTVVADSGDAPLANAEINFPKLKLSARSDSKGNFQISGVPAGPQELIVRRVGYESITATMTFGAAQKVEADFVLRPFVTKLVNVDVNAATNTRYAIRLADFEKRRGEGSGRFLTADVFERASGQNMSQLLVSSIPGVRTVGKGSKQVLVSRQGKTCAMQIIVNGMTQFNGREELFDINGMITAQVIGLEYYTVASTPPQFNATAGREVDGGSHCGTVVIWTK